MEIWLPVGVGVLVNIVIVAYFSGDVSRQVKTLTTSVTKIDRDNDEQWSKLNDHGERITWLEAKSNGKSAH